VILGVGKRSRVLEYRWRRGEGQGDYQGEQRTALLGILERRTRAEQDRAGRDPDIGDGGDVLPPLD
jgi:hypothetical protein